MLDSIELDAMEVDPDFLERVDRDFARRHRILGVGRQNHELCLWVSRTTNPAAVHNVGTYLATPVTPVVKDDAVIATAIDQAYTQRKRAAGWRGGPADLQPAVSASSARVDVAQWLARADQDLLTTKGKGPVVQLVDALLFEALDMSASDVHIQPLADRTVVRYRIDGVLHDRHELPIDVTAAVLSRIKVMGRMDIAERRLPQDGRATVTIGEQRVDLRLSTVPTNHGERGVVRLLDSNQRLCEFDRLGMPSDLARAYLDRAARSSGIVLVTGPTGSGKTTTLYATLKRTASPQQNIMTIEDPIEYELATSGVAVSQLQVNRRKGVTFSSGLRHILRQDPDVIMVGEIRDVETARMAIQSSLTGHLVFSTLHTNDAPSAVTRLVDLGVEPYLVSASISVVLAQRLVRTVHGSCRGEGCEACFGTGLKGRTGVFECLPLDEQLRAMVVEGESVGVIRRFAREWGMRTLREHGEALVQEGKTTALEMQRVVCEA